MSGTEHPRSALAAHASGDRAWWETAISDVSDGRIVIRGRRIEDLIGTSSFIQHLVFLATGRMLDEGRASLLEAVMVAGADHGPLAPSIAAARMAATCGVTFNSVVASGVNLLGDDHGGAAGNASRVLRAVADRSSRSGLTVEDEAATYVAAARDRGDRIAGFGHQLHTVDPRREPVLSLLEAAVERDIVEGHFLDIAMNVERALESTVGRRVTINIDGLWAIVICELDLSPDFAMGAFCLSRGAGIVAHALEESSSGVRIKGPCPPGEGLVNYIGDEPTNDAVS